MFLFIFLVLLIVIVIIVVGKSITDGVVEFKTRETDTKESITPEQATEMVITAVHELK